MDLSLKVIQYSTDCSVSQPSPVLVPTLQQSIVFQLQTVLKPICCPLLKPQTVLQNNPSNICLSELLRDIKERRQHVEQQPTCTSGGASNRTINRAKSAGN